jgi:hypothetical protein
MLMGDIILSHVMCRCICRCALRARNRERATNRQHSKHGRQALRCAQLQQQPPYIQYLQLYEVLCERMVISTRAGRFASFLTRTTQNLGLDYLQYIY